MTYSVVMYVIFYDLLHTGLRQERVVLIKSKGA